MNGVVSTSMREMGIVYKLNFGVALPEVREIASSHTPDPELGAALWKEDVRELKILATFLQPADDLTEEMAWQWVKEIPYLEIAEQCSRNLFWKLSFAGRWVTELVKADLKEYAFARTVAFLVWTELFKHGVSLSDEVLKVFSKEAMQTVTASDEVCPLMERMAAVTAMKLYGRQSREQAQAVLDWVKGNADFLASARGQEIFDDLHFEFEFSGLLD